MELRVNTNCKIIERLSKGLRPTPTAYSRHCVTDGGACCRGRREEGVRGKAVCCKEGRVVRAADCNAVDQIWQLLQVQAKKHTTQATAGAAKAGSRRWCVCRVPGIASRAASGRMPDVHTRLAKATHIRAHSLLPLLQHRHTVSYSALYVISSQSPHAYDAVGVGSRRRRFDLFSSRLHCSY